MDEELPQDTFQEYVGPERRTMNWDAIELRMRTVLHEFKVELLKDLYERSIDPLNEAIKQQNSFCNVHTQELTRMSTVMNELLAADLRNRMTKTETRLKTYAGILTAVGVAAITQIAIMIGLLLTHQIKL